MDGNRVRVLSRHFDQLLERNLSLFLDYIIAVILHMYLYSNIYTYTNKLDSHLLLAIL